jgi:hypothetical protein
VVALLRDSAFWPPQLCPSLCYQTVSIPPGARRLFHPNPAHPSHYKGIGENSALIRSLICAGLERVGVRIDQDANAEMCGGRQGVISTPDSRVKVGPGAWGRARAEVGSRQPRCTV